MWWVIHHPLSISPLQRERCAALLPIYHNTPYTAKEKLCTSLPLAKGRLGGDDSRREVWRLHLFILSLLLG